MFNPSAKVGELSEPMWAIEARNAAIANRCLPAHKRQLMRGCVCCILVCLFFRGMDGVGWSGDWEGISVYCAFWIGWQGGAHPQLGSHLLTGPHAAPSPY